MNQILYTGKNKKIKIFFGIQLTISIILLLVFSLLLIIKKVYSNNREKYSKEILDNYKITRIYAENQNSKISEKNNNIKQNQSFNTTTDEKNIDSKSPYIIGIIEISKINLYYPVFSTYKEDLLRISPCRFFGPEIGKKGNLCIAGHNYDNDKFFSKISSLSKNDEIILYNNSNRKFVYLVDEIYEVKADDMSPIFVYKKSVKQLTLITCNNLNKNRIIVKAFIQK